MKRRRNRHEMPIYSRTRFNYWLDLWDLQEIRLFFLSVSRRGQPVVLLEKRPRPVSRMPGPREANDVVH